MKYLTLSHAGVLLLLVIAGCNGGQKAAVEFNDSLTEANRKLQPAQIEFFESIQTARISGEQEVTEVTAAHDKLVETLEEVKAKAKLIVVPDSTEAEVFYEAQQAYIASEEKLIKEDYKEMLAILAEPGLNAEEKYGKLQTIADRVSETQKKSLDKVQAAQEAFAKKYNLNLE